MWSVGFQRGVGSGGDGGHSCRDGPSWAWVVEWECLPVECECLNKAEHALAEESVDAERGV